MWTRDSANTLRCTTRCWATRQRSWVRCLKPALVQILRRSVLTQHTLDQSHHNMLHGAETWTLAKKFVHQPSNSRKTSAGFCEVKYLIKNVAAFAPLRRLYVNPHLLPSFAQAHAYYVTHTWKEGTRMWLLKFKQASLAKLLASHNW